VLEYGIVYGMNSFAVVQRITLGVICVIMGFVVPLWVLVVFVCITCVFVPIYVEGVVMVMVVEYMARDFVGFGVIGWLCLLWMIVCESRRSLFRSAWL
jgi:hypothetical protein